MYIYVRTYTEKVRILVYPCLNAAKLKNNLDF